MARQQVKSNPGKSGRHARRRLQIGAVIVAMVVVAGVIAWFAYQAAANKPGEQFADQGNEHIQAATDPHTAYNSDPPTSGPHLPYIAPWGIHTRPVPLELQVHNLEDGGVVVQYNCECPELVEKLRAIVRRYDKHVLLAPYPALKSRIALTAWTRLDRFDEFDEKRIVRFIDAYSGIDHHKR
ncbi:MAG TPA: DUF3105 domain-containing protein [Candidatus Binatia bacterium]|nr:DUF3105 domain-containing protein [Candidatus Binatia bacterium]